MPTKKFQFPNIAATTWLRAGVFLILWLSPISLPVKVLDVSVDNSWKGVLTDAALQNRQFGSDLICTYGPLGYLTSDVYAGQSLARQAVWELLCKGVLALIVLWWASRLGKAWLQVLFVATACLFCSLDPDAFYFFLTTMLGFFLIAIRERRSLCLAAGLVGLALLAMTKFSYLLLGTLAVAATACHAWLERKPKEAGLIAGTYLGAFLVIWIACGQRLFHLPMFLRGAWELTRGYAGAMGLSEERWMLACGLAAVLPAAAALSILARHQRRPEIALLAGALFLAWKSGFVRADFHVVALFDFCLLAFFLYLPHALALRRGKGPALALGVVSAFVSLGTLYRIGRDANWPFFVSRSPERVVRSTKGNLETLLGLAAREKTLRELDRIEKLRLDMPRARKALKGAALDMIGAEQGLVLANGLNYRPRPVFQSYFAYTPYLLRRNAAFLADPRAPGYLLVRLDPIDGRFPASEDGLALREALTLYEPLFIERDYLLMSRKPYEDRAQKSVLLESGEHAWGQTVAVPRSAGPLWAEIDIRPTVAGRLLSFLYKTPPVSMEPGGYRLVPAAAREGFLLDPVLSDARSLARFAIPSEEGRLESFVLTAPPAAGPFFQETFRVSFFSLAR